MPKKKETRGGWNKKYKTEKQAKKAAYESMRESHKRTQKQFSVSLSRTNDADLIEFLEAQESMGGTIKKALRLYIESIGKTPAN